MCYTSRMVPFAIGLYVESAKICWRFVPSFVQAAILDAAFGKEENCDYVSRTHA